MNERTMLATVLGALYLTFCGAAPADVTNTIAFLRSTDTNLSIVVLDPPSWPNQRKLNVSERTVVQSNLLATLDRSLSNNRQPRQPFKTPPPPVTPSLCIDAYPHHPISPGRYSEQDKALWRVSVYGGIGFYVEWWSERDGTGKMLISGRQDADVFIKNLKKLEGEAHSRANRDEQDAKKQ